MSPRKADAAYLADMLEYARDLARAVAGHSYESYLTDTNLRLAVERRLEIIGEAANQVCEAFTAEHPEIPWRSVIGQRHALIHGYAEIDQQRIWLVATVHIPELILALEPLVPAPPPAGGSTGSG